MWLRWIVDLNGKVAFEGENPFIQRKVLLWYNEFSALLLQVLYHWPHDDQLILVGFRDGPLTEHVKIACEGYESMTRHSSREREDVHKKNSAANTASYWGRGTSP